MRTLARLTHPLLRWLLLVVLLMTLLPGATQAQETSPAPSVAPNLPQSPFGIPLDMQDARTVAPATATPETTTTQPLQTAALDAVTVQGDIQLDVTVKNTIHAGDVIEYTYIYTNTRTTAAALSIQAVWDNFSPNVNGNTQFCTSASDPGAGCAALNPVGPAVQKDGACVNNLTLCYTVASLAAKQSGRFSVHIGTKSDVYPKSGQAPLRPASSARLFVTNSQTLISEDTASTLIIGPVLTLVKTTPDASKKLYPTQTAPAPATEVADFTIKVSNAAAAADKINGVIRPDATDATNIVITDVFPQGSAFVSATGNYVVATTPISTVTWTIPGPLHPGDTLPDLNVSYRKLDVRLGCERLDNSSYSVTSSEYPLGTNNKPYTIPGAGVGLAVVTPMKVSAVVATPGSLPYGSASTVKITVQSYWTQPINNAVLTYTVQTNAAYVNNSAAPAATSTNNNVVTWKFNMPAATSRATPQVQSFTLQVQGTYASGNISPGRAILGVPAGIPSACTLAVDGGPGFTARLSVTKRTDADTATIFSGAYVVQKGDQFKYIIDLQNNTAAQINDIDLTDNFPSNNSADLRYAGGTATVDGVARNPDSVIDGNKGLLTFNDLSLAPNGKMTITYNLIVGGLNYINYCNNITATIGGSTTEPVTYPQRSVCVRTNPRILLTKKINGGATANVKPGDTVTFQLSLTNGEATPYTVGLYDPLNGYDYVSTTAGYDTAPTITPQGIIWKLQSVGAGASLNVTFTAKVSPACMTRDYVNEVMFHNDENSLIHQVPAVTAKAHTNCGNIEYDSAATPDKLSLVDRFTYTLNVRNTDANAVSTVPLTDVLPLGFTFVQMDPSGTITTAPTIKPRADGRVELHWTLTNVKGNSASTLKVIAKTGIIVGTHPNEFVAEGGTCKGACIGASSIKEVSVSPLITAEPKLSSTACANAGDTRIYQLAIVNTNNLHGYTSTVVTVTLPIGLSYVNTISNTATPNTSTASNGDTVLRWSNINIPARTGSFSQQILAVTLKVGNVLGNLTALVQANSADGAIPRKEGVDDPTITVCLPSPAIALIGNKATALAKDEVVYDITLANPTAVTITASIDDQLPTGLTYNGTISETGNIEPQLSNSNTKLSWTNVQIPPAKASLVGEVHLRFKVTLPAGKVGTQYKNTATVVTSSQTLDASRASFTVTIKNPVIPLYLPLIRRR